MKDRGTWTRAVPSVPISNRSLRSSKTESLSVSDYRPNQERQSSQITTLRESELVSARAAVNNGVVTPAIATPPFRQTLQRTTWSRPSVPFGGGDSLGADGPQKQQLKSRRAARKRGKKTHRKRTRFCSGAKLLLH